MVKATVVIPTFNRARRLGELLRCLARQSGDALARVVVCDDGSPDDTREVARSLGAGRCRSCTAGRRTWAFARGRRETSASRRPSATW